MLGMLLIYVAGGARIYTSKWKIIVLNERELVCNGCVVFSQISYYARYGLSEPLFLFYPETV